MGTAKDQMLEEMDKEDARMHKPDWPKCIRCTEPIDFDLVELDEETGEPLDYPSLCSYCEHMSR